MGCKRYMPKNRNFTEISLKLTEGTREIVEGIVNRSEEPPKCYKNIKIDQIKRRMQIISPHVSVILGWNLGIGLLDLSVHLSTSLCTDTI